MDNISTIGIQLYIWIHQNRYYLIFFDWFKKRNWHDILVGFLNQYKIVVGLAGR